MSHHGCFELRSGLKRFNRVLGVTRSLVTFSFVFFLLLPLLCFSFSFSFFFSLFCWLFLLLLLLQKWLHFFFSLCLLVSNELCRKRAGVCVCLVCIFFFLCFRGRGCACCIDYVTVFFFYRWAFSFIVFMRALFLAYFAEPLFFFVTMCFMVTNGFYYYLSRPHFYANHGLDSSSSYRLPVSRVVICIRGFSFSCMYAITFSFFSLLSTTTTFFFFILPFFSVLFLFSLCFFHWMCYHFARLTHNQKWRIITVTIQLYGGSCALFFFACLDGCRREHVWNSRIEKQAEYSLAKFHKSRIRVLFRRLGSIE